MLQFITILQEIFTAEPPVYARTTNSSHSAHTTYSSPYPGYTPSVVSPPNASSQYQPQGSYHYYSNPTTLPKRHTMVMASKLYCSFTNGD